MPQPFPDPQINGTVDLFNYANTVTDHWIVPGSLISLYIIVFLSVIISGRKTSHAFGSAGTITFIIASLFWALEIIQGRILMITLVLFLGGIVYIALDG